MRSQGCHQPSESAADEDPERGHQPGVRRGDSSRFDLAGPLLAVRPYCNNTHYWQVYFDTNRAIRETFGEAAYPVPDQHYSIRSLAS